MKIVDYLQPDIDEIRHQIMGILDSYSHEWDVIAELSQNAIDAIREAEPDKGRIRLEINSASREVTLSDNGVGLDPSQVAKLLRPFATNKVSKPGQIGEKGVGLKFVIFSSSHFEIQSKSALGSSSATLIEASAWLNSTSDEMLPLEFTEEKPKSGDSPGTTVRLTLSDADHPIFGYSFEELLYLLRTKTAIGDTGYLWDDPLNCDCEFIHFDKAGKRSSKTQ